MQVENQQIYDDIDYQAMCDLTRYGELGMMPSELAWADMMAHEVVCEFLGFGD